MRPMFSRLSDSRDALKQPGTDLPPSHELDRTACPKAQDVPTPGSLPEGPEIPLDFAATVPLPPPRAPRVKTGSHTAAACASLAEELRAADQGALASMLQCPLAQATDGLSWRPAPDATIEEAAAHVTRKLEGTLAGMNTFQGNLLREFMALRIMSNVQDIQVLGALSDLATDVQSNLLKQQQEASKRAAEEAGKAANKAAQMKRWTDAAQVALAGSTALVAVSTFGMGLPLLAIGSAALVGFVTGGKSTSPEEGGGFDKLKGLQRAGHVADAMMVAMGIGAALLAARTAAKTASKGAAEAVAQQMLEGAAKAAQESGVQMAVGATQTQALAPACRVLAEDGAKQVTQEAFQTLSRHGFKVLDASKEKAAKTLAERGGRPLTDRMAKTLAEVASGAAIDRQAAMTWQQLVGSLNQQLYQQSLKRGALSAGGKASEFTKLLHCALLQNMHKLGVTASDKLGVVGTTLLGQDLGTQMMRISLLVSGITTVPRLGVAWTQHQTTQHNLDAQQEEAAVKVMSNEMEVWQGQYDKSQELVQNLAQSRSKAIDAMAAMLKNEQQVNMMIARNYAAR